MRLPQLSKIQCFVVTGIILPKHVINSQLPLKQSAVSRPDHKPPCKVKQCKHNGRILDCCTVLYCTVVCTNTHIQLCIPFNQPSSLRPIYVLRLQFALSSHISLLYTNRPDLSGRGEEIAGNGHGCGGGIGAVVATTTAGSATAVIISFSVECTAVAHQNPKFLTKFLSKNYQKVCTRT